MRDLASVFARRAHVDQWFSALTLRQRFVEKSANFLVESLLRHRIICLRIFWDFARHRTVFRFPFVAAAIQDFYLLVSEEAKRPQGVASPPVRFIPVKNTSRIWRDSVPPAKLGESFRRNVVADQGVLQISPPIDMHGAGNVASVVKKQIFIRLNYPDSIVLEMFLQPISLHERFRMRVLC